MFQGRRRCRAASRAGFVSGWDVCRMALAVSLAWQMACSNREGVAAQLSSIIDAADCKALLGWSAYSELAGVPASCASQPCSAFDGVKSCDTTGRVTRLVLKATSLSGTLPPQWGALTNLQDLYLGSNGLSGTLPPQWGALNNLVYLYLNDNSLSGTLPPQWGTMTNLKFLDIEKTNLQVTSAFTQEWCSNGFTDQYLIDANGDGTTPCGYLFKRRRQVILLLSAAVALLVAVLVFRCWSAKRKLQGGRRACCGMCGCGMCGGPWVAAVLSIYGVGSIIVDAASDVWVLIQVFPKQDDDVWWPFIVLIVALFVPNIISTIAAWCSVSGCRERRSGSRCLALAAAAACIVPFTLSLGIAVCIYAAQEAFSLFCSVVPWRRPAVLPQVQKQAEPTEDAALMAPSEASSVACCQLLWPGYLLHTLDIAKHSHLLGLTMAVFEDPISIAATSAFYLINRRNIGQVLQPGTYFLSVCTSALHILVEAWTWSYKIGDSGGIRCVREAFKLRKIA